MGSGSLFNDLLLPARPTSHNATTSWGPSTQAHKPVGGISHINHDQSFPIKYCLRDLGGGRVYCSPELPCAYPAVSCLVCLFLMLSGLFQMDVSVVRAVSLVPREAILTSQQSQQLETIRPGSSSRPKTWSVGYSARQSKLTTGTQTRVGRGEQPTCLPPVLSVPYYIEFDINYPDHLFPMAGFIPIL